MTTCPFPCLLAHAWWLARIAVALALFASQFPLAAAAQPVNEQAYAVRWIDEPITLDGRGDEPAWQNAKGVRWPAVAESASTVHLRLLWDRGNLFFLAEMEDGELTNAISEPDGRIETGDAFALFLQPAGRQDAYYQFAVSPSGAVLDMFVDDREPEAYERFAKARPFLAEIRTVVEDVEGKAAYRAKKWTVEGRIPWTDLLATGGRPDVGHVWRFAAARHGAPGTTSPLISNLHDPSANPAEHIAEWPTVVFEGSRSETARRPYGIARRTPLTTSRVVGSPDPPLPYRAVRAYPKLRPEFPVFVVHEPGSTRLWLIVQDAPYLKTRIMRTSDDPSDGELEELLVTGDSDFSICFHPRFLENGYFYVGSNGKRGDEPTKCRIVRYTMSRQPPYAVDPASALVIIDWESNGHNGAAIGFGNDGMLYITSGDGTSDSDTDVVGQGLDHLLAKVLRIDVDHPDPGRAYSVPADNPFVGRAGARPETWAYGLRNPWRLSVDPATGHIWVGNNGQDLWEQIYLVSRGANYGWSVYEGSHPFYLNRQMGPDPLSPPMFEHPHSEARSMTGGITYHGRKYPELAGAYIYGDYSTGKIWGALVDKDRKVHWHRELADTTLQITSFGVDAEGELLITDHQGGGQGGLYTLEPNLDAPRPEDFPHTLSESGLFKSVPGHVVQDGLIPYSVNAPLWSDGTYKERFIAMPENAGENGEPPRIGFQPHGAWTFPNGTVLVKSFALDLEENNPASRRWIETRFLVRQQNEWVGYSYEWNDEQTDARLVDAAGADREFVVRTAAGGQRRQKWRYPSRTECMVCHSRAANYVLGPSTMQMNRTHNYDGIEDNQLRVLEHLGVLEVDWRTDAVARLRSDLLAAGKSAAEVDTLVAQLASSRQPVAAARSRLLARSPEEYDRLPNPYDESEPVELRARAYLHSNCAHCHVMAGGGNAQFDVAFATAREAMKLIDERPVHHTFGIPDARLIAPGDPDRSVLLHRMSIREPGQMPQLATELPDEPAVQLIRQWILELGGAGPQPADAVSKQK